MEPCDEVGNVTAERFERRVGLGRPHGRHLADHHGVKHVLQLCCHDNQAFDGALHVLETSSDRRDEPVEAQEFLDQHRVH